MATNFNDLIAEARTEVAGGHPERDCLEALASAYERTIEDDIVKFEMYDRVCRRLGDLDLIDHIEENVATRH